MYFVQETDKLNGICNLLNLVKLDNNKILLPVLIGEEISEKKSKKMAEKTKKILDKCICNKLIISKNIKKIENYINYLHSYNIKIVDGKWLFQVLSSEAIEYVVNKRKLKKEDTEISILVNDLTEILLENIKQIIRKYKKVNIVTNHSEKFKNIEKNILEEEGIIIAINNNKRKSLSKSKIILNADFPTELINKYTIFDEAIIINLRGNVKINKKRFNGININDYEIQYTDTTNFDEIDKKMYDLKDIYEANIYHKQPFKNIQTRLKINSVQIKQLIGNNINL